MENRIDGLVFQNVLFNLLIRLKASPITDIGFLPRVYEDWVVDKCNSRIDRGQSGDEQSYAYICRSPKTDVGFQ